MSDTAIAPTPAAAPSAEDAARQDIASIVFAGQPQYAKPAAPAAEPAPNSGEPGATTAATPSGTPTFKPEDFIREQFNFNSPDELKAAIDEWKTLKATPPQTPELKFANDESRLYYEYLSQGKEDDLYNALHGRKQVKGVDTMDEDQQLKLMIRLQNPMYDQELIDYAYQQSYGFDDSRFKNPETGEITDKLGYKKAQLDAQYKRQSDLKSAQDYFSKYKQQIELQPLQAPAATPNAEYEAFLASKRKDEEYRAQTLLPALKAVQNIPMSYEVNDPGNQMNFGVNIATDKDDLTKAQSDSENIVQAISELCFDQQGNFQADKLIRIFAWARNEGKYAQSIARQAVNAERARVISVETPAPATAGREVTTPVETDADKLKKFWMGPLAQKN